MKRQLGFVVLLALCGLLAGCRDKVEPLIEVETQKEANQVLVALNKSGIEDAECRPFKAARRIVWLVSVKPDDLAEARAVLVQYDLPRERHSGYADMLDNQGIIPSATDDRARLMHAMAGELERTLELFDKVVAARVHVVLPEVDPLRRKNQPASQPSALVVIKYLPEADNTPPKDDQDAIERHLFGATKQVEDLVRSAIGTELSGEATGGDPTPPVSVKVQFTPAESQIKKEISLKEWQVALDDAVQQAGAAQTEVEKVEAAAENLKDYVKENEDALDSYELRDRIETLAVMDVQDAVDAATAANDRIQEVKKDAPTPGRSGWSGGTPGIAGTAAPTRVPPMIVVLIIVLGVISLVLIGVSIRERRLRQKAVQHSNAVSMVSGFEAE